MLKTVIYIFKKLRKIVILIPYKNNDIKKLR